MSIRQIGTKYNDPFFKKHYAIYHNWNVFVYLIKIILNNKIQKNVHLFTETV